MSFTSESSDREEIERLKYINRKLIEALEDLLPELSASQHLFIKGIINDAEHGR